MKPISDTRPPEENSVQMISLIAIFTILVFYADITTPLGLMIWILYFIPLFLTLYIKWEYGPVIAVGSAIILIGISYFLSPRDMSEFFALINRVFFSLMLGVSALLIWQYKKREVLLEVSEERYQTMIETSPDTIVITRDGVIHYINPTGLELCDVVNGVKTGSDIMSLFDPADQEIISSNLEKVLYGARTELPDIRIRSSRGRIHLADVWMEEIPWDGDPAVEMIIRTRKTDI